MGTSVTNTIPDAVRTTFTQWSYYRYMKAGGITRAIYTSERFHAELGLVVGYRIYIWLFVYIYTAFTFECEPCLA